MQRTNETKRAKADTWTRKTCRIAVLSLLLIGGSGCSIIKELDDPSPTGKAFLFGGVLAGAPVAIACLPLTFPIGMQSDGWGGLAIMAGPAIPTGVVGGLILAAPVAILDFVIGTPIRYVKRRREQRAESERGGPELGSRPAPARPRRANPARPPRVGWAPKPPPRLKLKAGAVPPICEPDVQRDIEQRTELERTLIPLRPARRR